MSRIQKKVVDGFIDMAINKQVKGYFKKGMHPTVEQVVQDINEDSLDFILLHFTIEEIKEKIEKSIRRQECKE